jgi:hypothetical protein
MMLRFFLFLQSICQSVSLHKKELPMVTLFSHDIGWQSEIPIQWFIMCYVKMLCLLTPYHFHHQNGLSQCCDIAWLYNIVSIIRWHDRYVHAWLGLIHEYGDRQSWQTSIVHRRIHIFTSLCIQEKSERYTDACDIARDRFGGGSDMVWGGIAFWHNTL